MRFAWMVLALIFAALAPITAAAQESSRTCDTAQGLHELFSTVQTVMSRGAPVSSSHASQILHLEARFDRASMLWDLRNSALSAHSQTLATALSHASMTARLLEQGHDDFRVISLSDTTDTIGRSVNLLAALDCNPNSRPTMDPAAEESSLMALAKPSTVAFFELGVKVRTLLLGTLGFVTVIGLLSAAWVWQVRREDIRLRYFCDLPATLAGGSGGLDHPTACRVLDISRGGARLTMPENVDVTLGTQATINFAQTASRIELKWHKGKFYGVQFTRALRKTDFQLLLKGSANVRDRDAAGRQSTN